MYIMIWSSPRPMQAYVSIPRSVTSTVAGVFETWPFRRINTSPADAFLCFISAKYSSARSPGIHTTFETGGPTVSAFSVPCQGSATGCSRSGRLRLQSARSCLGSCFSPAAAFCDARVLEGIFRSSPSAGPCIVVIASAQPSPTYKPSQLCCPWAQHRPQSSSFRPLLVRLLRLYTMRLLAAATLLASAPTVFGQNFTFLSGLLQTLTNTGHTQLASVATKLNSTTAGQAVLTQLSSGSPFVLFAPTDNAFSSIPSNVTADVTDVISYHIASGNFTDISSTYPNVTLGNTLLNNPQLVQLEASGQPQALAWATRADGKVHVLNQLNDATVSNTTAFGNVTIHTIDHVLSFPGSLAEAVALDNTSLALVAPLLHNVSLSVPNASAPAPLFDILNGGLHGFTFFAPNDAAITQALSNGLAGLAANRSAALAVFQNHLINGSTVYSPLLAGPAANRTSAAGETLRFVLNATGHYVSSGAATARIVQPDVLLANGVVHVIDGVLLDTDSDPGVASAAASSASVSAAGYTATAAGPIGFSATATSPSAGASETDTGGTHQSNAARKIKGGQNAKHVFKMAIAFAGALVGMVVI